MRSKAVAFWLSFFLGYFGVHRFYLGKPWTGLLWFFSSGLILLGNIFDLVSIAFNFTRDGDGNRLVRPGFLHDLIIKLVAVLTVFSIISVVGLIYYLITTQPDNPIFHEFPMFPEAINV